MPVPPGGGVGVGVGEAVSVGVAVGGGVSGAVGVGGAVVVAVGVGVVGMVEVGVGVGGAPVSLTRALSISEAALVLMPIMPLVRLLSVTVARVLPPIAAVSVLPCKESEAV